MMMRSLISSATLGLLTLLQFSSFASAKNDGPRISSKAFEHPLENIFYFDDSDVVLGHDRDTNSVWRSPDAGETWDIVQGDGQKGAAWDVWSHPWDNKKAYILGLEHKHWKTDDRGKTWTSFETEATPSLFREPFSFHGRDSERVIFHGQLCEGWICDEKTYYTEDNFESISLLRNNARGCLWAVSTPMFGEDSAIEDIINDRVFCIIRGPFSPWPSDNRFVVSDDFFLEEKEVTMSSGRTMNGFINMAPVKSYIVAAAKAEGTDELALFVTHDASTWHRAEFGTHRLEQDAYTILESTNYSLQVDVMTTRPTSAMGVLFTSNSNGTYFTRNIEHTNRGLSGLVDFEKISGIQGIVLVNTVENWEHVEKTNLENKEVKSSISFDDGRTFQNLKVGDKRLHLHSVSDLSNSGRVFSSPAPGIVMGIGNTGDHLKPYRDGSLFVSDDAGVTWREGVEGPHKYEFGDQGSVIMAISDDGATNKIQYSINHGKDWTTAHLEDKVIPKLLTTTPDSTSLKFLMLAAKATGEEIKWFIYSIDFEGLHERKCGKDDFEKWPARVDEDGKASCLMGHKQFYRRRKANADCFIDEEFKDPEPQFESCECTKADFECDFNFVRSEDRQECIVAGQLAIPAGACENPKDTFKGSSGWRLIPGNECKRAGGKQLDDPIERPCSDSSKTPATGEITTSKKLFEAPKLSEFYYLERPDLSKGFDETIVMKTEKGAVWLTRDHGKKWERILEDEHITGIIPHQYFNDVVFFLTDTRKVVYSYDRCETFHSFQTPDSAFEGPMPLAFHPNYKDWLIWTGAAECPGKSCHAVAHYTTDRGDNWNTLLRYVRKCEFIRDPEQGQDPQGNNKKLVYCEQFENENPDNALQLLSSKNWFADKDTHFNDILDFAVMSEFIIVAARAKDQQTLKVDASVDGATFADAQFPPNFQVDHQQAYTVLDSSTHAVFLHVTVNNEQDHEHGTIIKSNSNGTSYTLSMSAVNRDRAGYVDFEKMQGLEGVAMVNVVSNLQKSDKGNEVKKLKTMITHNDGAEWQLLSPPQKRPDGKNFACRSKNGKATDKCALHLHSFTERDNKQATFGSNSATGLMLAVGNVGEYLHEMKDDSTHTFITRDAGITWKAVKKGVYLWEYGDQGSLVVIVEKHLPTKVVYYSLDEGETWTEYQFSEIEMDIDMISTVPSDNSFNFLLWGRDNGKKVNDGFVTVNLDFSGLKERDRLCDFNENEPVNKDYYLWSPKHPLLENDCLFGHIAQYHRKRIDADCRNGPIIDKEHDYAKNCTCTRRDYECDYNYERMSDGSCQLVDGLLAPDHSQICKDEPDTIEYYAPTGYRRIPLTTCQGGMEYDKVVSKPCPGKGKEYSKKHGISGVGLFFAIVIPIAFAGGFGYWAWGEYQSGRLAGFGQIRLGDSPSDGENPFITGAVNVIAGTWTAIQAIPLLSMSLWRSAKGYFPVARDAPYRSRGSFAARRQDYSSVVADEDELLGDDLDEDAEV
ncbi:putative vacuolar protein sorting protein [Phaeomoniella chlamydospora]|uniref:Vacuolar protein sorting/targeting protein 10 n=1 Tax=Phaeomoniella chlamydospora TaxID=158046 RepID=A0A0G2EUT2_PHACM|nr:putative vacuolar protein sorting protein [Phaeomoniella chlamydospora]